MKHKKTEHREKISICRNAGGCMYGDSCWFNHDKILEFVEPNIFKCTICGIIFDNINDLMKHKKHEHGKTVKKCNNGGKCFFGKQNCWFHHNQENDNDQHHDNENKETTQKLFSMMEKFTNRIIELENQIKPNNSQIEERRNIKDKTMKKNKLK